MDIFFHFSSKLKNLFVEFCEFCDQQYCKILKFHSVRWLCMSTCIERVLRLLPSLKSYVESLDHEMKNGVEIKSRINRLINTYKHPLLNELLRFLGSALPPLIQLNLLLQRVDPLIHILYDSLFSCTCLLLSRFAQPEIVRQYKRGEISYQVIKVEVLNALLEDETVTKRQIQNFYAACLEFHRTPFPYIKNNFPIKDALLKHVGFFKFL